MNTQFSPIARDHYFASTWDNTFEKGKGQFFKKFTAKFCVPEKPETLPTPDNPFSIHPWIGMVIYEKNLPIYGVLQPVLIFGGDVVTDPNGKIGSIEGLNYYRDPYWYWSAQYFITSKNYLSGPMYKAEPGDELNSCLEFDPANDAWKVSMSNGKETSTIVVKHPNNNPELSWSTIMQKHFVSYQAVIETWYISAHQSNRIPPNFKDGNSWRISELKLDTASARLEEMNTGPIQLFEEDTSPGEVVFTYSTKQPNLL